jgi:metal-responsive CopG/Arc/MetJ family transcriptional regulator
MATISVSLPDSLLLYMDTHVENRSALIETLLEQWKQQNEDEALAVACSVVDELRLGWDSEWQSAAILDL